MKSLHDRLLDYYSLNEEDYARMSREPSFDSIPFLDGHPLVEKAVKRIKEAIAKNEKVIVYGDFDCDGIMATSIIAKCFHELGKSVSTYIPSRYQDGYGLNLENAKKIAESLYKLVILVDNGVSCLEEVSYLLSKGIETIIIDHHGLPSDLPPAFALLHPETLPYGKVPVSAGYLSFIFSKALLGRIDPYLGLLGAISTVSDLMPIKAHNQEILALALRNIRKEKYPQILNLTSARRIDEKTLGMDIIPLINAVGRMDNGTKANRLVHYFAEEYGSSSLSIGEWMIENNKARKELTALSEAKLHINESEPGICATSSLPEGLNGLLANRIMDKTNKATAILSPSKADPSLYVGSIRCKDGFDVLELQGLASALIEKGGGHAHAGGLSIKKENYPEFRKLFLSYCASHPFVKKEEKAIPLALQELTMDSFKEVRKFGPFGMGHEEPKFLVEGLSPKDLTFTRDGRFLSLLLQNGAKLFSFSFGKDKVDVRKRAVDFMGTMSLNEWRDSVTLTLTVDEK